MFLERLVLENFRCFGPSPQTIEMCQGLTALIGANGSGKTAVMQALLRLFGITPDQRRIRRQDFHVPVNEKSPPSERKLAIEAILSFPELDDDESDKDAVPEFFHQMAVEADGRLKCRLRLEATWTDDGSLEGDVQQKFFVVRNLGAYEDGDCSELKAIDRVRIQMIYVPAVRDAASQVTAFLRGRLWRAVSWSKQFQVAFDESALALNEVFGEESAVSLIAKTVERRWQELYSAGTDTTPVLRPVELRFQRFLRKLEIVFQPDEAGRERSLDELSDGQRSLFHLAMTAAALDLEAEIVQGAEGFDASALLLPSLTLIAIEEPENSLSPFYLARIVQQIEGLTQDRRRAQAIISSHSPSILARVDPNQVRYCRLDPADRTAQVRAIRLPDAEEEAAKFVREAVRSYRGTRLT